MGRLWSRVQRKHKVGVVRLCSTAATALRAKGSVAFIAANVVEGEDGGEVEVCSQLNLILSAEAFEAVFQR